ncbi:MAG: ABC-ATPase domain-containing protein [Candidatus Latescibacteria bacterium]|jgi:predicted ABC-class ATPase|nr:ABC-ATPase domain-containing protein [Candidatus Latescibacterota bacterium]
MEKKLKQLDEILNSLDGKMSREYKKIADTYDYGDFSLIIDYVPDDPSNRVSRLRVRVPMKNTGFPKNVFAGISREIAARDFLSRSFGTNAPLFSLKIPGGRGGRIAIDTPNKEILETSAVVVGNEFLEIRFIVELPIINGKIPGSKVVEFFMKCIPGIIRNSLFFKNIDNDMLVRWFEHNEDADALRNMLGERGLVAFIADGSALVNRSFHELRTLDPDDIVLFETPDELAVTFDLPNRGKVRGMGIPAGITLITGGKSHGKSTLLRALELGIYNHIPGDDRELVVTVNDAVGICAEEGRRIERVDISPFVANTSKNIDTENFSSECASALESQTSNIMEALEFDTSLLLIDEDTSAANLITRDARMQALVPKEEEPATPLVDILPVIRDELNVSTVLIGSGSGDYFDCADTIIAMKNFKPFSVTAEAKRIARENPTGRVSENNGHFSRPKGRCPLTHSLDPLKIKQTGTLKHHGSGYVQYGEEFIDVSKVTQLIKQSQARGISRGIALVYRLMDGSNSLKDAVDKVMTRIETVGLDTLSNRCMGDLAGFRAYELAAAINRIKRLKVK